MANELAEHLAAMQAVRPGRGGVAARRSCWRTRITRVRAGHGAGVRAWRAGEDDGSHLAGYERLEPELTGAPAERGVPHQGLGRDGFLMREIGDQRAVRTLTRTSVTTPPRSPRPTRSDSSGATDGGGATKIHLGSANVLMEPNDAYLCIVRKCGRGGGKVFLPFEDDRLALIISKAFLPAADTMISDETILRQIKGAHR